MKALKLSEETREAIFIDIIHELWKYSNAWEND